MILQDIQRIARQHRHGPERTDQLYVQLDPHQKQQDRNAQFRQQVDLFVRMDDIQRRRPGDETDRDEADNQRLAEQRAETKKPEPEVKPDPKPAETPTVAPKTEDKPKAADKPSPWDA